jgi:hypothetical protein
MGARWIRMDCVENDKLINGSGGTLWGNAAASTKRDTEDDKEAQTFGCSGFVCI